MNGGAFRFANRWPDMAEDVKMPRSVIDRLEQRDVELEDRLSTTNGVPFGGGDTMSGGSAEASVTVPQSDIVFIFVTLTGGTSGALFEWTFGVGSGFSFNRTVNTDGQASDFIALPTSAITAGGSTVPFPATVTSGGGVLTVVGYAV